MTLPNFEGWAIFASVADTGSFSAAALELGLSKATVSKAVARLERELGVSLFHRTSRRLSLTDSGAGLIERARLILAEGRQAEECGRESAVAPAGLVRLAAPMSFGLAHLGIPIARFLAANPGVSLEVALSDEVVDLVSDGFDAALRVGQLSDSSLLARKLCDVDLLLCASPQWLARHGAPDKPEDLPPGQLFRYLNARGASTIRFIGPRDVAVKVDGRLGANNADVMLASVEAGLGIALLPDFIGRDRLTDGRLVRLLPGWTLPPLALFLLTPPGRLRPRRVTALLDFLQETLARPAV